MIYSGVRPTHLYTLIKEVSWVRHEFGFGGEAPVIPSFPWLLVPLWQELVVTDRYGLKIS